MADLRLDHLHEAKGTLGTYLEAGDQDIDINDTELLLYAIASALTSIAESLESFLDRTE